MDTPHQEQAETTFLTRDRKIRKRILDIYNKEEEDFSSKDEWNSYLEELEDVVFNLVEGVDVEQTEQRLRAYKLTNIDSIEASRIRRTRREQDEAAAAAPGTEELISDYATIAIGSNPSQPAAGYGTSVAGYVPSGMTLATGMAATAPAPMVNVEMNAAGDLPSRPVTSKDQHQKMAAASGWTTDITRRRALHDAFTSLFVT